MARGKFNKRGGGPRLDAVNAEEIEQRNQRLAELEEERAQRRAEEEEEGEEGEEEAKVDVKEDEAKKGKQKVPQEKPAAHVTTQAEHNKNMAKLAEVRKRREQAEARRKMEEEAMNQQEEERKRLAALAVDDSDDEDEGKKKKSSKKKEIPKLDKIAIKKMKPAQMKEHLKERGLDYQGNAKALQDRLLKYEAAR